MNSQGLVDVRDQLTGAVLLTAPLPSPIPSALIQAFCPWAAAWNHCDE